MSRRVFLHVGSPKTGTSYLQSTMAANRTLLGTHGITYPQTKSGTHFEAAIDLTDHPWGGQLKSARGEWDKLAASALAAPHDVVISHEVLAAATPAQVARARRSLKGAEVHVILTVRDLARQLPAEWQEKVKHRGRQTMAEFLAETVEAPRTGSSNWFWRVQHVPDVLSRWSAGLPAEHVHVVTVAPAGAAPAKLWRRFAKAIEIDHTVKMTPGERDNSSLGIAEVGMLRLLNDRLHRRSVPTPVYADVVRDLIARDTLGKRRRKQRIAVPPSMRDFVDEVSGEWLEWIEGSGVDVRGKLPDLESRWPDEEWVDPDDLTTGPVTEAAVDALAVLVQHEADRYRESPATRARGVVKRLGW